MIAIWRDQACRPDNIFISNLGGRRFDNYGILAAGWMLPTDNCLTTGSPPLTHILASIGLEIAGCRLFSRIAPTGYSHGAPRVRRLAR